MKVQPSSAAPHTRRVYIAGRNVERFQPRPCNDAWHAGPFVRASGAEGEVNTGRCATCGLSIQPDQVRRPS